MGIFRRNGAPTDRSLLQSLTQSLAYRGPDGKEIWSDGSIGFGHTLLRTTYESLGERQPASLDGQFWITADARIDCRPELASKLEEAGRKIRQGATDPELILHAYATWGEDCVQHLRGDFAFGIWDAQRTTLFCARDHFGVKPFYYADLGGQFLFSNTMDCVRLHPQITEELNEAAVADFLLFGLNCDVASTTFRDVHRLPAAHSLSVSAMGVRVTRYWSAPVDGRIRYRRPDDYVEHFQTLLQSAVADRLRITRAGIWLSGGMDSSSIAAVARELSVKAGGTADLRAYTMTYGSLIPDQEGAHARKTAEFLKIPIQFFAMDELPLFGCSADPEKSPSEPVDNPFFTGIFDQYRTIAADCRVMLSGQGGDNLMEFQMWPYARDLIRNREWRTFFSDTRRYLRQRKFSWRGIGRRSRKVLSADSNSLVFPPWMEGDLVERRNLRARWKEFSSLPRVAAHPILPKAHASLFLPQWSRLFEIEEPGTTHCPVEVRYPFLDLRVVNFLLAVPPFPWSFQKRLLREAMAGHLPESVRQRPKTPLQGDPCVALLQRPEAAWLDQVTWNDEMARFVDRSALTRMHREQNSETANAMTRVICLNFWLQSRRQVRYNNYAEAHNG